MIVFSYSSFAADTNKAKYPRSLSTMDMSSLSATIDAGHRAKSVSSSNTILGEVCYPTEEGNGAVDYLIQAGIHQPTPQYLNTQIRVRAVSHKTCGQTYPRLQTRAWGVKPKVQSVFITIYCTKPDKGKHVHSRDFITPDRFKSTPHYFCC